MKNKIFCITTILLLLISSVGPSLVAAEPSNNTTDSNSNIAADTEYASGYAYALKGGYDGNINKELDDPHRYIQHSEGEYIPDSYPTPKYANLIYVNMTKVANHFNNDYGPSWSINGSNLSEYFIFANETAFNQLLKDNKGSISNDTCYNATYDSEMVKIQSIHPNATIMNLTIKFNTIADTIFIPYVVKNQHNKNITKDIHVDGIITFPYNSTYLYNVYKEELMKGTPVITYGEWMSDSEPVIVDLGNNTTQISQNYVRVNKNTTPVTHSIINITYDQDDTVVVNNSSKTTHDEIKYFNHYKTIIKTIHSWITENSNITWSPDWSEIGNTTRDLGNNTTNVTHYLVLDGNNTTFITNHTNAIVYDSFTHKTTNEYNNTTQTVVTPVNQTTFNYDIIHTWGETINNTVWGDWSNTSDVDVENGTLIVKIDHNRSGETNYTTIDYINITKYDANNTVLSSNLSNGTIINSIPLSESYYIIMKYWDTHNNTTTIGEWVLVNVTQEVQDLGEGVKKVITHNTYNRTNTTEYKTFNWREIITNQTGEVIIKGPEIFNELSEIKYSVESEVRDVIKIISPTHPEPEPVPNPGDNNSTLDMSMLDEDENVDMAEFVCT